MADYDDEGKVQIETELEDFEFVEEDGEVSTCVVQRLLCNQKNPDTTQRFQIFYSRCLIKNKVCNLIIDNVVASLFCIGGLFETRYRATPSSIHY